MPEWAWCQCLTLVALVTVGTYSATHIATNLEITIIAPRCRDDFLISTIITRGANMTLDGFSQGPHTVWTG